jgi:hypothetical protein
MCSLFVDYNHFCGGAIVHNYSEYKRFQFFDLNSRFLFTDIIGCNSTGQLRAEYQYEDGRLFYLEDIGNVQLSNTEDPCYNLEQKIESLVQKHLAEVHRTLRKIDESKDDIAKKFKRLDFSMVDAISFGFFSELRKRKASMAHRYAEILDLRRMFDHYLRLNIDAKNAPAELCSISKPEEKEIIRDDEWPLEATLVRLLLVRPYSESPLHFTDFIKFFFEVRQLRLAFIDMVAMDYELYSEGKLVFQEIEGKRHCYDQALFDELCQLPQDKEPLLKVIDDRFIEEVISKKYVPESSRSKLLKFKGLTIGEAINKAEIYGNLKRAEELEEEEVNPLEPLDYFLFQSIYWMCRKDESYGYSEEWGAVKNIYPYLSGNVVSAEQNQLELQTANDGPNEPAWLKLKLVYKYLSGETKASSLDLKTETLENLLRIIKMFHLAISLINLERPTKKLAFEGDEYHVREVILGKVLSLNSCQVFTKTLFPQKLSQESYRLNPKNWMDLRVGIQIKLFANMFFLARSLSGQIGSPLLTGSRGNSGSGKSTELGKEKGILNPDTIKYALRAGSNVKNHQIHLEGAAIFNLCFVDIVNAKLNYIVDLRLITLESIVQYLVKPAKINNCTINMSDFDVPLLTTLNRVLNRDPKDENPIPSLEPMVSGFINIRKKRAEVLDFIEKENSIKQYNLYYLGEIVGRKELGKMVIDDESGFQKCLSIPDDEEIAKDLDRIIDESYISEAYARGDFWPGSQNSLSKWIGKSVREALEEHANT